MVTVTSRTVVRVRVRAAVRSPLRLSRTGRLSGSKSRAAGDSDPVRAQRLRRRVTACRVPGARAGRGARLARCQWDTDSGRRPATAGDSPYRDSGTPSVKSSESESRRGAWQCGRRSDSGRGGHGAGPGTAGQSRTARLPIRRSL
jgi:hypothetical protein